MRTPTKDLIHHLKNPEYARLYGRENAKTNLAITLSRVRRDLGLTQKQFAEKLEVSPRYIDRLEAGEANPTLGDVGGMLAVAGLKLKIDTEALISNVSEHWPNNLIHPSGEVAVPGVGKNA